MPPQPPRLGDLHCDWLLQYAEETTVFDPSLYQGVKERLPQADGYLTGAASAVISCYRREADWETQKAPWSALDALITRIEAEFPGRLLMSRDDLGRWRDDPDGMCWALIGVEGFDSLIRAPNDLNHLKRLFDRGVRLFQPIYATTSLLGGSAQPGDNRGLEPLGRSFVAELGQLAHDSGGPRPILDLAHLNPQTMSDILAILENDPALLSRLLLVYSHGAVFHPAYRRPRAISIDNLARLRALGGTVGLCVGPPFYRSGEVLKAAVETVASVPFLGKAGIEGIAIGTDFLGVEQTQAGLSNVGEVVDWIAKTFPAAQAEAIIAGNASKLFESAMGA